MRFPLSFTDAGTRDLAVLCSYWAFRTTSPEIAQLLLMTACIAKMWEKIRSAVKNA